MEGAKELNYRQLNGKDYPTPAGFKFAMTNLPVFRFYFNASGNLKKKVLKFT
jgi:hypothetical protein